MALDDTTIEEFYKLGRAVRKIPEDESSKSLKGILHEEVTKYFLEKKDKATHEHKWKDDEELREFSDSLWDKAANHVAEKYLKMSKGDISSMKSKKDPEDENLTQFETFMAQYLGRDKEEFFDQVKDKGKMTPDNLAEYTNPIYTQHIAIRTGKKLASKIKTSERAEQLLEYTRMMAEHNPDDVTARVPGKYKSVEESKSQFLTIIGQTSKAYHPKKPDTYAKK